jgi:cobalt/nickel transport protein
MQVKVMSSRSTAATSKNRTRPGFLARYARHAPLAALAALATAPAAQAHFQLLYTPEAALNESAALPFALVFAHPFDNGYTMDMGTPEAFYVVSQRGPEAERETTDLAQYLEPIVWAGLENEAAAWIASPPRRVTRSLGDYTFVLRPSPYYESQEDKYIQQITKTMVNIGGIPGAWDEPLGLPVEIVPLDKPYANWVGGVFRAVVLADGKPVPHAEIEIEYLNHEPDIAARRFDPAGKVTAPQGSFVTLSIRADANGQVTIGLPAAGWWGICALNLDDGLTWEGKELSLDAVLWVKATAMTP